jgi:hypothetical protein
MQVFRSVAVILYVAASARLAVGFEEVRTYSDVQSSSPFVYDV